ncbi:unnamed protein product [Heligmosomoides polygyrus]|uniref:SH2 domain-containing protein n=1 Tax=Heligmosomoides polygyrus TaxID=6339 RepID=A0A183G6E5_HELPZ|nr:unnamed protein product [Heligmosomoides polygyrus]
MAGRRVEYKTGLSPGLYLCRCVARHHIDIDFSLARSISIPTLVPKCIPSNFSPVISVGAGGFLVRLSSQGADAFALLVNTRNKIEKFLIRGAAEGTDGFLLAGRHFPSLQHIIDRSVVIAMGLKICEEERTDSRIWCRWQSGRDGDRKAIIEVRMKSMWS